MKTLNEIKAGIEGLNAMLMDKGWRLPKCEYNFDGKHWVKVSAQHPVEGGDALYDYARSHTNDDAKASFDKARALIADLPDSDTAAKDDFRKALGALIDKGNKLGIETDFMNPLTEQMRALSENILTHSNTSQ